MGVKCYNSPMTNPLSHLDESGRARMVDVGHKPDTERLAIARGEIVMRPETLNFNSGRCAKKGRCLDCGPTCRCHGSQTDC